MPTEPSMVSIETQFDSDTEYMVDKVTLTNEGVLITFERKPGQKVKVTIGEDEHEMSNECAVMFGTSLVSLGQNKEVPYL